MCEYRVTHAEDACVMDNRDTQMYIFVNPAKICTYQTSSETAADVYYELASGTRAQRRDRGRLALFLCLPVCADVYVCFCVFVCTYASVRMFVNVWQLRFRKTPIRFHTYIIHVLYTYIHVICIYVYA